MVGSMGFRNSGNGQKKYLRIRRSQRDFNINMTARQVGALQQLPDRGSKPERWLDLAGQDGHQAYWVWYCTAIDFDLERY